MRRHSRHYCGIIANLIIMILLIIEQLRLPCRLNYTAHHWAVAASMPTYLERLYCSSLSSCGFHAVLNLKRLYCSSLSSCGFHAGLYYTAHHWAVAASMPHLSPNNVGRTSSLHYYYLAFVVLTYLVYLIVVNTNYISSYHHWVLQTWAYKPIVLDWLDWFFGESEKSSLSPSIHSRISSHSIVSWPMTVGFGSHWPMTCTECAWSFPGFISIPVYKKALEDLTGTSNNRRQIGRGSKSPCSLSYWILYDWDSAVYHILL